MPQSMIRLSRVLTAAFALACIVLAGPAVAQQQSETQQACIVGVNKSVRGVAKAQARNIAGCIKEASSSGATGAVVDTCIASDLGGRVGKATAKTAGVVASKCSPVPSFGFTGANTANAAAIA